jgi:hypothetical protein
MIADRTQQSADGRPQYAAAPLRVRILAGLIDFVLVLAAAAVLLPPRFAYFPLSLVVYHTVCVWLVATTPGKALLGLELRRLAAPPSLPWALARSSVGLFFVNGFGLGFLAAVGDPARRALHDRAFGSLVVCDEAAFRVPWKQRLKTWLERRDAAYQTKAIGILAGVWSFLEWVVGKLRQAAEWSGKTITALRSSVEGAAAGAVPAAPTAAQAVAVAVGCSAVTTLVLITVPGAAELAQTVASPVAAISSARGTGAVRVAGALTGGGTQLAVGGQPVEIRADLETRHYSVDFGDGTAPVNGAVGNEPYLSLRHEYAVSSPGTTYDVVLTVTDEARRSIERVEYRVEFVGADADDRVAKAIGDGLWWLHRSQSREEHPTDGPLGHWGTGNPVGETAAAALAFEVNGFQGRDAREGVYGETVRRALAYLLSHCVTVRLEPQRGQNPDANGNGFGITTGTGQALYEVPLVAMALIASRQPGAIAATGGPGVRGRRYDEIVADMLEFMAFAQDDGDGPARGGWRYTPNSGADTSVTQWPVLAMMAAQEVSGLEAPDWVRTELRDHWLLSAQAESGGFGYQGPSNPTVGQTAAGLLALQFAGVPDDDRRVTSAVDFIASTWDSTAANDYYAMYAVMKAAKLRDTPIQRFGDHDWQLEYRRRLLETQSPEGSWPIGPYQTAVLATAWPVLILSEEIFAESRLTALRRWLRDAF